MRTKLGAVIFTVMCLLYAFHLTAKAEEKVYHTTPTGFPHYDVTGTRNGYLFLGNVEFSSCPKDSYAMILDGDGELVYYQRVPDCGYLINFQPQSDGTLTYWLSGTDDFDGNATYQFNNRYEQIGVFGDTEFEAGFMDSHEYTILPNGHTIQMFYVDKLTAMGGTVPQRTVTDIVLREVNAAGDVLFEWDGLDHVDPMDAYDGYFDYAPLTQTVDYIHSNAVEVDHDGNWLLSSRHFNEITKINRATGDIIWRLGGEQNDFDLLNDDRWFSHQHDIRRLPNGHISLFDNGNYLFPPYSRYVEYAIDENELEITKVREITYTVSPTKSLYAFAMGSARNLPNGHVLIGWGAHSSPVATEYDASNEIVFDVHFPAGEFSYRAYSGNWVGKPLWGPTIAEVDSRLYFSLNGSTEVAKFSVWGGAKNPDILIATVPKDEFEESAPMVEDFCVYKVVALDSRGKKISESLHVAQKCLAEKIFFPIVGQP